VVAKGMTVAALVAALDAELAHGHPSVAIVRD